MQHTLHIATTPLTAHCTDANGVVSCEYEAACGNLHWLTLMVELRAVDWRQSYTYVPHTHTSDQHSRHFAADSQASDETEYPVTRPDHVFVYRGPLAQTVARLKVAGYLCLFHQSSILAGSCVTRS